MKYYYLSLISIISAFILFTSIPAKTEVCESKEQFTKNVAHLNPIVYRANERAREAFDNILSESLNKEIKSDEMLMGLFKVSGMMFVGIVFFNDNCVIKGSTATMPAQEWVSLLLRLNLSADDFTKLENA